MGVFDLQSPAISSSSQWSSKKKKWFESKKTDRGPVEKRELKEQIELCDWMREVIPGVHFRCDTASGGFSSEREKELHMRQQSSDKEPDVTILAARKGYNALVIEYKKEGTDLRMKRDGTKIRVKRKRVRPTKKYPTGWKIVERDYKIRKKGDWASLHIEKQANVLEDYRSNWNVAAFFAVGPENYKKIICWYFDIKYTENTTIF